MAEKPIEKSTAAMMVATALFFDMVNAVPFLNIVTTPIAHLTFWLWFKIHGISYRNPKRAATMAVAFIIDMVPILSIIPAMTLATIITLFSAKMPKKLQKIIGSDETNSKPDVIGRIGNQDSENNHRKAA